MFTTANVKRILLVLATLVAGAHAYDANDNYKAFVQPWMFTITIVLGVLVTRRPLINACKLIKEDKMVLIGIASNGIGLFCSFFLLHTSAWDYGLVAIVMFYSSLLASGSKGGKGGGSMMSAMMLVWFFILVGMPDGISNGLIATVSKTNCNTYYNTQKNHMCKAGWVTYALIMSAVIICMNFVSVAVSVAKQVAGEGETTGETSEPWVPKETENL